MQAKFAARRAAYKSGYQRKGVQAARRLGTISSRVKRSYPAGRLLSSSQEQKDITIRNTGLITLGQTTSNAALLLNGVAPGTGSGQRIGRRITLRSIDLKFEFTVVDNAGVGNVSSPLRLLVVYDRQPNAATPGATQMLLTDELTSPNNLANSRRFETLFDEIVPCVGSAGPASCMVHRYKKLQHDMEFNTGSAGTVADIVSGAIWFLAWQDGTIAVGGGGVTITSTLYTRVRFTDN